jgi:hypothetical protein
VAREPLDRYFTPHWCTELLLDRVWLRPTVLEPCAGRGDIVSVLKARGYRPIVNDITDGKDFLTWVTPVETIITNPPYRLLAPIILHALAVARDTFLLLRLTALEPTRDRRELLGALRAVYILPRRPKFVHGASDSVTSAWFHFRPGPEDTKVYWL